MIPKELLVDDLALTQRQDVCDLQVHRRAVACDTPGMPHRNSVTSLAEVADRFHYVGVPGFADLLPLAHDCLPANAWPRLRPTLRGPHDGIWIVQITKGIHVPRVPSRIHGSHDLHVRLRHRLLRSLPCPSPLGEDDGIWVQPCGAQTFLPAVPGLVAHDEAFARSTQLRDLTFKLYSARWRLSMEEPKGEPAVPEIEHVSGLESHL